MRPLAECGRSLRHFGLINLQSEYIHQKHIHAIHLAVKDFDITMRSHDIVVDGSDGIDQFAVTANHAA